MFGEHTQRKCVTVHPNGVFEAGKVIYIEAEWSCHDLLNAASTRLDLTTTANRLFNANGVEIDDCIMIEDDDILFLSNGDDFIAPTIDNNSHNISSIQSRMSVGNNPANSSSSNNSNNHIKLPAIVGGYVVGKLLGRGAFGEVRVGEHQLTGERVALKFLKKSEILSIGAAERTITEIQCLTALRHQNIIRLQQHLESPQHVILVFELMDGGDLKTFLHQRSIANGSKTTALSEDEARLVFHQLVSGVSFAHNQHICHRDLKLENILLKGPSLAIVKIADFGLSAFYRPGATMKSSCGTLSFLAPEVFSGASNAGPPLDVWSLGVILFALLCGRLPFEGSDLNGTKRPREAIIKSRIIKGQYKIDENLGPEAKDLVRRMLKLDPAERASIPEVLNHVWMRQTSSTLPHITDSPMPPHLFGAIATAAAAATTATTASASGAVVTGVKADKMPRRESRQFMSVSPADLDVGNGVNTSKSPTPVQDILDNHNYYGSNNNSNNDYLANLEGRTTIEASPMRMKLSRPNSGSDIFPISESNNQQTPKLSRKVASFDFPSDEKSNPNFDTQQLYGISSGRQRRSSSTASTGSKDEQSAGSSIHRNSIGSMRNMSISEEDDILTAFVSDNTPIATTSSSSSSGSKVAASDSFNRTNGNSSSSNNSHSKSKASLAWTGDTNDVKESIGDRERGNSDMSTTTNASASSTATTQTSTFRLEPLRRPGSITVEDDDDDDGEFSIGYNYQHLLQNPLISGNGSLPTGAGTPLDNNALIGGFAVTNNLVSNNNNNNSSSSSSTSNSKRGASLSGKSPMNADSVSNMFSSNNNNNSNNNSNSSSSSTSTKSRPKTVNSEGRSRRDRDSIGTGSVTGATASTVSSRERDKWIETDTMIDDITAPISSPFPGVGGRRGGRRGQLSAGDGGPRDSPILSGLAKDLRDSKDTEDVSVYGRLQRDSSINSSHSSGKDSTTFGGTNEFTAPPSRRERGLLQSSNSYNANSGSGPNSPFTTTKSTTSSPYGIINSPAYGRK